MLTTPVWSLFLISFVPEKSHKPNQNKNPIKHQDNKTKQKIHKNKQKNAKQNTEHSLVKSLSGLLSLQGQGERAENEALCEGGAGGDRGPTAVKPSVDARLHDLLEYGCVFNLIFP